MDYQVSEAPEGYTWKLVETNDPSFAEADGKTMALILYRNGKEVERRGVFVPAGRESDIPMFLHGMEENIRMSIAKK